jgi:PAS domain S-box-containing protein
MVEIRNAKAKGRSLDERWHLRKDGTRFFMSGVMVPILHHPMAGYVKIARNITDRKLMEEALFLSEQRRNVVQSAEIGEWDWDITTDITQLSEQTCSIFGIAPCKTISGSPLLEHIHSEDLPQLKEKLETALKGLNIFHAEFRINRADNNGQRWVTAYGRVVGHENDTPTRMLGVVYDVTNRKLLEKQKDDFISVASHELKTPVTTIKAYSGILEEVLEESGHPESVEIMKKLDGQVDRLVNLINSLLDANSVEGKMKLNPQTFDLNELAAEQVKALQISVLPHQLTWKPGNLGLVHADRERIGQVITNFITNAAKYSPGKDKVIITTEDAMDGAVLKVQDFGIGLSAVEQGQVFERYYRANSPGIASTPGLGLGLYISAEIIRQHSGAIWVESVVGKGSSFCFKLPYS